MRALLIGMRRRANRPTTRKPVARITVAVGAADLFKGEMMEQEFLLQFFAYAHLPERLQAVSRPFGDLANAIVETLPRNPERTVALRKLLEAKDCAVRALVAES